MEQAAIIGIARHRIGVDGDGVTTLVVFHGCGLNCKYCINPQSLVNYNYSVIYTVEELYDEVKADSIYFIATNGGITFGGGEPLLQFQFIKAFRQLCDNDWRINVETSLNVPQENLSNLLDVVDGFIVDVKDMNPEIYKNYTGKDNAQVIENLKLLCEKKMQDKTLIRLPLIPGYNSEKSCEEGKSYLEKMGFERFESFDYINTSFYEQG